MPTEEEKKEERKPLPPIPEDNRVTPQSEPEVKTETKVEETPSAGIQYLGKTNNMDVYKTGETLHQSGKTTTTTNKKVLNKDLSQAATEARLATFPRPEQIEALRKLYTPLGEDKNNQERLDRLNRMGKINEFGRVVNVLGDAFSLVKGANVRLRKPDDIAPRLFDAENNIFNKKDDADRKRNDDIMKVIAGRAARPVYDTVTTKEEKTDYTKNGKYQMKDPNAGKDAGKDNSFNIYNETGQVVATVEKDKAMKALSMIEQDRSLSATDMNSVRLMKVKMADGSLSDNEIYYLVQGLSLKYPSVRKFLGVSDSNSERGAGETVPFKNGIDINGQKYAVTGVNVDDNNAKEDAAIRNTINKKSGVADNIVAEIDMGGTRIGVTDKDLQKYRDMVTSPPDNGSGGLLSKIAARSKDPLTKEQIDQKALELMKADITKQQTQQYQNADGTPKQEIRQTATGQATFNPNTAKKFKNVPEGGF